MRKEPFYIRWSKKVSMPKLTYEHRPEESDRESYMDTKRRVFQMEGTEM